MAPTLVPGNRVLVAKFYYRFYRPQHGDIIVFRYPSNKKKNLIKRVMALPGETIRIENGLVYINGVPLQGDRFNRVYFNTGYYGKGEQAVPENSYFVLGDNREHSRDSRYFGPLNRRYLIGRVMFRGLPLKRVQFFKAPTY